MLTSCIAVLILAATCWGSDITSTVTYPASELQNQNSSSGFVNFNTPSNIIPKVSVSNFKRNDWWPPTEQEITQTVPYSPDIHSQVPASYYFSAVPPHSAPLPPPPPPRSEPYSYPYEFPYPVVPPNLNNQLIIPSKYMTIALFIGLLTLFAIIQGSMMTAAKQKEAIDDALSSRKKRDLLSLPDFQRMTPEQIDIFNNDAKIRCIQRTVCHQNQQIIRDFGQKGLKLAVYLTRSVKRSVTNAAGWDRLVEDAGKAGVRGEDCNVVYRDCVLPVAEHPDKL